MKVYYIVDEVRKSLGKKETTYYRYSFEMDEQILKRTERYKRLGYKVEVVSDWWTNKTIKLLKED